MHVAPDVVTQRCFASGFLGDNTSNFLGNDSLEVRLNYMIRLKIEYIHSF